MVMLEPKQIDELRFLHNKDWKELAEEIAKRSGHSCTEDALRKWARGDRHPRFKYLKTLNDLWNEGNSKKVLA